MSLQESVGGLVQEPARFGSFLNQKMSLKNSLQQYRPTVDSCLAAKAPARKYLVDSNSGVKSNDEAMRFHNAPIQTE
jgi:hypothetical protein